MASDKTSNRPDSSMANWVDFVADTLKKTQFNGTAVGILDQSGTGGEPHVQPGAEEARDRDLHQIRP